MDSLNVGWPDVLEMDEGTVEQLLERLHTAQKETIRVISKRGPMF